MSLADAYDLVVFDLDGVIYLIDKPIDGAAEAVERLRAAGTSVSWFCLAEELPVGWDEVHHRLRHATGVLVTKVPATPTRIRAAIRDKEARR